MSVVLHYGGRSWVLAPELTAGEVVLRAGTALHARVSDQPGAAFGGAAWVTFPIAGGGEITVHVHDGMNLVLEDDTTSGDRQRSTTPSSVRRIR